MGGGTDFWWTAKVKGLYSYGISPFYQKTFGNDWRDVWKAFARATWRETKTFAFPTLAYLGIILWAKNYVYRAHRKNPDDYLNDE